MKLNINIFRLLNNIFICDSEINVRLNVSKRYKYTCIYGYEYISNYVSIMFNCI